MPAGMLMAMRDSTAAFVTSRTTRMRWCVLRSKCSRDLELTCGERSTHHILRRVGSMAVPPSVAPVPSTARRMMLSASFRGPRLWACSFILSCKVFLPPSGLPTAAALQSLALVLVGAAKLTPGWTGGVRSVLRLGQAACCRRAQGPHVRAAVPRKLLTDGMAAQTENVVLQPSHAVYVFVSMASTERPRMRHHRVAFGGARLAKGHANSRQAHAMCTVNSLLFMKGTQLLLLSVVF